ncbi:MAG: ribosome small subunit-dependent GTPase A [Nitrosomonas sp.]|jgi:ribosome biogenesis GTPase
MSVCPQYATGQITAAYGRRFEIETEAGTVYSCIMRGKKHDATCGDQVEFLPIAVDQGVIETILPRTTLFYRCDAFREKLIAANVTQLVYVLAAEPSFNLELLDRCLIAAQHQKIQPLILLNKTDLVESTRKATRYLQLYRELGYPVLTISAKQSAQPLIPYLSNHTSLFAGQSGMGKSTLLNNLIPNAHQSISDISTALDSGRHTTTHTRLFHLDKVSHLIDSPGFQEFGLQQIDLAALAWEFIDFRNFLGKCQFRNCRHLNEPQCALKDAMRNGNIEPRRMASYQRLAESVSNKT